VRETLLLVRRFEVFTDGIESLMSSDLIVRRCPNPQIHHPCLNALAHAIIRAFLANHDYNPVPARFLCDQRLQALLNYAQTDQEGQS
jgi:hypothetical protein